MIGWWKVVSLLTWWNISIRGGELGWENGDVHQVGAFADGRWVLSQSLSFFGQPFKFLLRKANFY